METQKDKFEKAIYKHLQDNGFGSEKVSVTLLNSLIGFMYKTCLGELTPIDVVMQQKEMEVKHYKEGFNAATQILVDSNKTLNKAL